MKTYKISEKSIKTSVPNINHSLFLFPELNYCFVLPISPKSVNDKTNCAVDMHLDKIALGPLQL